MKLYYKWVNKNISNLTNKTFIVTGANVGIGYYIALYLAYKNATVIMACRNINKANIAKEKILKEVPYAKLDILQLDISSKNSINNFSKTYQEKYTYCNGLIHNAGIYHLPFSKNVDGFEIVMATNYLGVVLLTNSLLPVLKSTKNSRIIFTTSISHKWVDINYQDFYNYSNYKPTKVYARSKLAVNRFFVYLANKFKNDSIKVCISHPGICATNLINSDKGGFGKTYSKIGSFFLKIFVHSPSKASLSALYAAGNKNVKNMDVYGPRGLYEISGYPKKKKLSKKSYKSIQMLIDLTQKDLNIKLDI